MVPIQFNDRDSMINDLDSNEGPGFRTKKFCLDCYFGIIGQLDSSNQPLTSHFDNTLDS